MIFVVAHPRDAQWIRERYPNVDVWTPGCAKSGHRADRLLVLRGWNDHDSITEQRMAADWFETSAMTACKPSVYPELVSLDGLEKELLK